MEECLSVYIEDSADNDNFPHAPRELDIYSSVPPETLNQKPPKSIDVVRRQNGEYEVHASLGKGRSQYMFPVSDATGFPVRVPFHRVNGAGAAYESETMRGGRPPQHNVLHFSANGNEITRRMGPGRPLHYHRVAAPGLCPAA